MKKKRRKIIRGKLWTAVLIALLTSFPIMGSPGLWAKDALPNEKEGNNIPYNLFLEVDGGQMNLHATQVNLSKILAAIANQTGLTVVLDQEADQPLTIDIEKTFLDIALKRLLRDVNYAGIWQSVSMGDHPDEALLIALYVYPKGKSNIGTNSVILGIPREFGRDAAAMEQLHGTISHVAGSRTDTDQISLGRDEGLNAYQEEKSLQVYLEKKKIAFLSIKKQKENEKDGSALDPGSSIPEDLKSEDLEAYIEKKKENK